MPFELASENSIAGLITPMVKYLSPERSILEAEYIPIEALYGNSTTSLPVVKSELLLTKRTYFVKPNGLGAKSELSIETLIVPIPLFRSSTLQTLSTLWKLGSLSGTPVVIQEPMLALSCPISR